MQLLEYIDYSNKINLTCSLAARELLFSLLTQLGYTNTSLYKLKKEVDGKLSFVDLPVHFSISHSPDFVICTIDTKHEIGVDVEKTSLATIKIGDVLPSFFTIPE